ncbi:YHS domain-containing (seleno)protein [Psychroserpens jangbogonensis]|uniref:YHS domain-containing (seleno)protein n=1 Tax=Psychroserpens jangbogonensis TaxID=1484460 RepID=UPI00053D79E3|nr:YHS domain-containing (seleno)protein [Psychroserpens jangbogonensis]
MKTLKRASLVLLAFLFTISLSAQDRMANNVDNSTIHLQGYSPVSYLDLGIAQKGLKEFKSVHENIVYYFTSVEQKMTFDNNPNKYKPQYGGFCAFGIYAGAKFRPDPNKFIVKDGKYFLFLYDLNLDAQQLWLSEHNHNKLVAGATKNWKKLSLTFN